jgi:hypothetical protein
LIVSYLPADYLSFLPTPETQWSQLARALAIDLFIQAIEKFNPLAPLPTADQIKALVSQVHRGGRLLERLARHIIEAPEPEHMLGLSQYWELARRPAVRHVARSPQLIELLQKVITLANESLSSELSGQEALQVGIQAARIWGFKQIFILIDGVDNQQISTSDMLALIRPLLGKMAEWQEQGVVLKLFLPLSLQSPVSKFVKTETKGLPLMPFTAIIRWSDEELKELLVTRFRAAQSRRLNFEDLAGVELQDQLDSLILKAAAGSPRRLISVISALVDAHVARDPEDVFITVDDWEYMRESWVDPSTRPPAIHHSVCT